MVEVLLERMLLPGELSTGLVLVVAVVGVDLADRELLIDCTAGLEEVVPRPGPVVDLVVMALLETDTCGLGIIMVLEELAGLELLDTGGNTTGPVTEVPEVVTTVTICTDDITGPTVDVEGLGTAHAPPTGLG